MLIKHLVKKVDFYFSESTEEKQNRLQLEYYLVESNISNLNRDLHANRLIERKYAVNEYVAQTRMQPYIHKTYGIEVIRKNKSTTESESIIDLTASRDAALQTIDKLARNSVTPVALFSVIDDIINF